ncbi:hypothetical protein RNJ44_00865 [Nakaseomyces bracarensis]|uniref:Uncharacterized protein n=1 Tax=Nakaseomyces bracarensis TaxID=273131 RepID=A0ABR4NQ96_9SACH
MSNYSVYIVPARIELTGHTDIVEEVNFDEVAQLRGKELNGCDLTARVPDHHAQVVYNGKLHTLEKLVSFEREQELSNQEVDAFHETVDLLNTIHS